MHMRLNGILKKIEYILVAVMLTLFIVLSAFIWYAGEFVYYCYQILSSPFRK